MSTRSSSAIGGLLLATAAFASGPDVIVGDLDGMSNWTSSGAIGGYRAYSVGTVSCNIGDAPLQWNSSTNMHPVISGNIYRLANGRFEQVGQSWLKHGFTALQGVVCGTCPVPDNTGRTLMPGCSDPYSSSLNGQQNRLGPKSEVNPYTGVFTYPMMNTGNSGSIDPALFKRIVVAQADIADTAALYFVGSMYVAQDDAGAGNGRNNASYRRIAFANGTGGNFDASIPSSSNPTRRSQPAIFAWRDHGLGVNVADPGVVLNSVDIPGDGRIWVAAKVVQVGSVWRYQYAVQNLNSDRAAASFSIPIPPGAIVSNTYFHDVNYHSGEPYNGTDWNTSSSGSAVAFSCTQTYAQNPDANALRWDTLYNFGFDCNVPPAGGLAELGLFKPGTPGSVSVGTIAPSADGLPHPINDSCLLPTDVGPGSYTFSTVDATTDGPTQVNCGSGPQNNTITQDVWYRYTAACDGVQIASLCGSSFDTKIAVYASGSCPTGPDTALACNDDFACSGGTGVQSQASFNAAAGQVFLIRVGGHTGATGAGVLSLSGPLCDPQPPVNDSCANAVWLPAGVAVDGTTLLATNDGTADCGGSSTSPDVWYKYRPLATGSVTVSLCDSVSSFDTVISVYSGSCGSLVQMGCNDDSCGLRSSVTATMTALQDYYIRVSGYQGATGNFKVKVTGGGGVVPPPNDVCSNRAALEPGLNSFSTLGALTDGPVHAACTFSANSQVTNDVWFNYQSPCDGTLRLSTCGTANYDVKMAVYSGNDCVNLANRLLACADNTCGAQAEISIPVVQGAYYTVRVGGYNGATGSGQLLVECTPNPPCPADYNQDGGVDGADVDAFFADWEQGLVAADFNQDGGVDGSDVDAFFASWENGC